MPRIDVPFNVNGQIITQPTKMKLASGGQNYFYAVFDLCDTWNGVEDPKAKFIRGDRSYIMPLVEGSDEYLECKIPWEVLTKSGILNVGVFGGDRLPTNLVEVEIDRGCCDEDEPPSSPTADPTPDWFGTHDHDTRYYTKEEIENMAGNGLKFEDGVFSVDTADKVEEDNSKPITSGAVYVEIGNIELLLSLL